MKLFLWLNKENKMQPKQITLNSTASTAAGTETASFAADYNFKGAIKTEILVDAKFLLQQRYSGWPGASQPPK